MKPSAPPPLERENEDFAPRSRRRRSTPAESKDDATQRARLSLYLLPVLGVLPALWTLYRQNGDRRQLALSRLAVTLAFAWLLAYALLGGGASMTTGTWSLRLLLLDGMLTSGYFLTCLLLLWRLWRGQAPHLPGVSQVAEGVVRKHLS